MSRALAVIGLLFALLLAPPVHSRLFALEPLHDADGVALWTASALVALVAVGVLGRSRRPLVHKLALLGFVLAGVELGARCVITHFTYWPREKLAKLGRATYPDLLAYRPHPFLQFTGRPDRVLQGNTALNATTPFNRDGFPGPDVARAKPPGTCRIVCLGASTTASGYPALLEDWLRSHPPTGGTAERYECVNLSHGFYDSTHSVVNFTLNAVDYAPDYVVIHHGWNDGRAARNASHYRGDHSHVLKAFEPPRPSDWPLIRASVLYRFVRFRISGNAGFEYLDAALLRPDPDYDDVDLTPALATFDRNLRTIVDLALLRGITPVLATLPYSTEPEIAFAPNRPDLPRFAAVMREVAASHPDRVLLVDLEAALTGHNELFVDLAHMVPAGRARKAELIGEAILAHRRGG
ncbi:MAG: hypothetical protein KDE27_26405 [Planctomycetes bacterium]|nr:hypothetical protein [Planctomycetota bacterium]